MIVREKVIERNIEPFLPLLPRELLVSVKENHDSKNKTKLLRPVHCLPQT